MDFEAQKVTRWQKIKDWSARHKRELVFGSVLFVIVGIGASTWAYFYYTPDTEVKDVKKPAKKVEPEKPKFYSPLTGVEVPDEGFTKKPVTAIMIENSPDARPQSGLKDAGVIFETIAEGGITRFAVIYQEGRPGLIGPVRSLRPYYLEWISAFDASIAHVGGSKRALDEVRNGSYKDIDQFFNSGAYWRASDRYAPHNVYTNFDRLDVLNQGKGYNTSTFAGFPRKAIPKNKKEEAEQAAAIAGLPNAGNINVNMSSATYNSGYIYDPPTNTYHRLHGTGPHTDRESGQITPKVVVVIKVNMYTGFEDGYREQIDTVGTGTAYIFQDGKVIEGSWEKPAKREQIKFKDAAGKEVGLNRGQTWITAISNDKTVNWN